jgi:putative tryptophan/tyrosine transport system substrate-binding protein
MRRRDFITVLGGFAAWPLAANAQQPTVGFLDNRSQSTVPVSVAGWRKGLRETGFVDGQNVVIEYRWANGQSERLPDLAAELVRRKVDVIVPAGGAAALIVKTATSTIPIVFVVGSDPVKTGLVASLNRPGGNATGVTLLTSAVLAKRLELLHQLVPGAVSVGALIYSNNPSTSSDPKELQVAAIALGVDLRILRAGNEREIDDAFASATQQHVGALLVDADTFFDARRNQLISLAARAALPACYSNRAYVAAGGLLSYGEDREDSYRQAGLYVGRILKGEKPADLPVVQPTKFELTINLKTAKGLGITVPASLLATADEVIE